eukprot:482225_1
MNKGMDRLHLVLWYVFHDKWCLGLTRDPKNKENIKRICVDKWVKWPYDKWKKQIDKASDECGELYELLTSTLHYDADSTEREFDEVAQICCRFKVADENYKTLSRSPIEMNDYINEKERIKIMINNTKTNTNYIKLAKQYEYEYAFKIKVKGDNKSELDVDIGWVLISKSNNGYEIKKEWTWNGLTGIKKEDEQEIPNENNVPPLQWGSGVVIECVLNLRTREIYFCFDERFEFCAFDEIDCAEDAIFCPVIYSVKFQHLYDWNDSILNGFWTDQNGNKYTDSTYHCKLELNSELKDDTHYNQYVYVNNARDKENNSKEDNKHDEQKIIPKPITESNTHEYIPLEIDTHYNQYMYINNARDKENNSKEDNKHDEQKIIPKPITESNTHEYIPLEIDTHYNQYMYINNARDKE